MKKQISRISVLQSSKVIAALYALMGLIYTLIGVPMIIFGDKKLMVMGIFYALMPIIGAIFGFVFFVIFAALYNVLAKWLGGIEFEVEQVGD